MVGSQKSREEAADGPAELEGRMQMFLIASTLRFGSNAEDDVTYCDEFNHEYGGVPVQ